MNLGLMVGARTGGEANAISIRIARAASGKDGVAICGYVVGMIVLIS